MRPVSHQSGNWGSRALAPFRLQRLPASSPPRRSPLLPLGMLPPSRQPPPSINRLLPATTPIPSTIHAGMGLLGRWGFCAIRHLSFILVP